MTNNVNLREISLDILLEINEKDQYIHVLLNEALSKYQYLEKKERAFISRLVRGTLERRITLDYCINQVSKVPVNKMKPLIRNLMRMSAYQIIYMDKAAEHVVCNEAVKLASKRGFSGLKGFVNGVLRNLIRQLPQMDLESDMSVKYSVPAWLADFFIKSYGKETAEMVLADFMTEKKMSVMTNTSKISRDELVEKLKSEGIKAAFADYVSEALYISDVNYLDESVAFRHGDFYVQDVSSMLSMHFSGLSKLAQKEDGLVLDVCAAPGGKSVLASLLMQGKGKIISRDLTYDKVSMIDENCRRLGISNIETQVFDATSLDEALKEKVDFVIADLPCSGLGIIGRKPDIKYNVTPEKLKELSELQKSILDVIAEYVKHGGELHYSTCTLNPVENEANFNYLLLKGFKGMDLTTLPIFEALLEDTDKKYHEKLIEDAKKGYITILPGIMKCDGFFISSLIKE